MENPESYRGLQRQNDKPDLMIDVVSVGAPPKGFVETERSPVFGDVMQQEPVGGGGAPEYDLSGEVAMAFRALMKAFKAAPADAAQLERTVEAGGSGTPSPQHKAKGKKATTASERKRQETNRRQAEAKIANKGKANKEGKAGGRAGRENKEKEDKEGKAKRIAKEGALPQRKRKQAEGGG